MIFYLFLGTRSSGYRRVSQADLSCIVDRLAAPTTASNTWRHDYDTQATHVHHLKRDHPQLARRRSVSSNEMNSIVSRLTAPTVSSIAARWNFDCEDANLTYLKRRDSAIKLPLKTPSRGPIPGSQTSTTRGGK